MKLNYCLNKFLEDKELRGLSSNTLSCYKEFVGYFINFLGFDFQLEDLNELAVRKYISYTLSRNLSINSQATYIRHLKIFLKWLETHYNININAQSIKVPKTTKKRVYVYSDEDIKLIFRSICASSYWLTCRNYAIIATMLDSGLRRSEVCNLQLKDFIFDKSIVKIKGKGNKERFFFFFSTTKNFIFKYIKECPYNIKDYLFLSSNGEPITTNCIKMFVNSLSNKLPFDLSAHKLRHNFATNYILDQYKEKGKVDIYQLKALMGHSDIETTERYLHIANEIIASNNSISHLDNIFN